MNIFESLLLKSQEMVETHNDPDFMEKMVASNNQVFDIIHKNDIQAIAGNNTKKPLNDANRLARMYGGNPSDWSKIRTKTHLTPDGDRFSIHAYHNTQTNKTYEPKTKFDKLQSRQPSELKPSDLGVTMPKKRINIRDPKLVSRKTR